MMASAVGIRRVDPHVSSFYASKDPARIEIFTSVPSDQVQVIDRPGEPTQIRIGEIRGGK